MRTSCRISYRLSYRISYRITYRISHLLPANSDWAPAAAPWLCILPTGPVSAADSALLCLCSESRRGLQHTVFLFPFPGPGPPGAARSRRPGARSSGSAQLTNPPVSSGRITQEHAWKRSLRERGGERRGTRNGASGEVAKLCQLDAGGDGERKRERERKKERRGQAGEWKG